MAAPATLHEHPQCGNLGTITAYGGSDPDKSDIDVLDLQAGIDRGDWTGVRIYNTNGQLIYDSLNPVSGHDYSTLRENGRADLMKGQRCRGPRQLYRDRKAGDLLYLRRLHRDAHDVRRSPKLQPVRVAAGSLGDGLLSRDTVLSPNHRLPIQSARAALLFAENEVPAPIKQMIGAPGITQAASAGVTYVQIMFERHEVVLSDGVRIESFQPGDNSLGGLAQGQRDEIFDLLSELDTPAGVTGYGAA
jgi:hypothetical protein